MLPLQPSMGDTVRAVCSDVPSCLQFLEDWAVWLMFLVGLSVRDAVTTNTFCTAVTCSGGWHEAAVGCKTHAWMCILSCCVVVAAQECQYLTIWVCFLTLSQDVCRQRFVRRRNREVGNAKLEKVPLAGQMSVEAISRTARLFFQMQATWCSAVRA